MKIYFALLFLVIGIFAQNKNNDKDNDKATLIDLDDDYGNPDIYGLIERPCPVYDRFCIRGFFAKHSYCKIVPGPAEEPYYVTEIQIYLPSINTTATTNDSFLRGLNGLIREFYINKATGNLVLIVYFEDVSINSRQTYFRFFKNRREPVERSDITLISYKQMTVNIVIPNYQNLRLDNAEITGYLDNGFPPFTIGPRVLTTPDPTAQQALQELIANIPDAAKDNMLTVSPLVGKIFVQNNICDFGIPVNRIGYHEFK